MKDRSRKAAKKQSVLKRHSVKTKHSDGDTAPKKRFHQILAARRSMLIAGVCSFVLLLVVAYPFLLGFEEKRDLHSGPSTVDIRNQALKLNGGGQVEQAIELLERATKEYPHDHDLALDLATQYAFAKRYQDALPAYEHALQLLKHGNGKSLDIARALTWIGVCHRRLGRQEEASPWMEKSRKEHHDNAENLYHLCISYVQTGRIVEGGRVLAEAMKLQTKDEYFSILSQILSILGFWDILNQAWYACLEVGQCRLVGNPYSFHLHYAVSLEEAGLMEESRRHFEAAAELSGKDVSLLHKEANSYRSQAKQKRVTSKDIPMDEEAMDRLHVEFINLFAPLFTYLHVPAWSIIQEKHVLSFRWPIPDELVNQALDALEQQKKVFRSNAGVHDMVNAFTCLTLPIFSLEDCNFAANVASTNLQNEIRKRGVSLMDSKSYSKEGFGDGPLHIGLFSGDIRGHPMMSLLNAFFKYSHTLPDVRVTLYYADAADPVYLDKFKPYVDQVKECSKTLWMECVHHARETQVQVWLETTGYTGKGIPTIAAAGPAPVGVLWAGFPGSLGMMSTIQYVISDRFTVPVNSPIRRAYPEHILYMPGSWMIADPSVFKETTTVSNITRQGIREQYGIPLDAFVFCHFGRFWKVDDKLFKHWCDIIRRVTNSYLVMVVSHVHQNVDPKYARENIRKAWVEQGLPLDRLVILAPFMRGEHLQVMSCLCDVALDTAIYGGGTTAYEALYVGLPLVHTAGGEKMMQRAGGSVLTAAGLADELIGKDFAEYVEIAVRLGTDIEYYRRIKQRVEDSAAGHDGNVLFHAEVGIAGLVDGLKQAYSLWHAGKEPRDSFADEGYVNLHDSMIGVGTGGTHHEESSDGLLGGEF